MLNFVKSDNKKLLCTLRLFNITSINSHKFVLVIFKKVLFVLTFFENTTLLGRCTIKTSSNTGVIFQTIAVVNIDFLAESRFFRGKNMNSIGEECTQLKKNYDDCFNNWFTEKFLKGDHDDTVCAGIFKIYQECVKVNCL